jgi:hypothetical protein
VRCSTRAACCCVLLALCSFAIALCSFAIALCRSALSSIARVVAESLAVLRADCLRVGSELRLQVKPAVQPACQPLCPDRALSRRRAENLLPVARACVHQVNGIHGTLNILLPGFARDRAARRTALVVQRKADIARGRAMTRARFVLKRDGALGLYQLLDDQHAVYIASQDTAIRAAQAHAGVRRMSALLPDPRPPSAVRASRARGEALLALARPIPQNEPVRAPLTKRTHHAPFCTHTICSTNAHDPAVVCSAVRCSVGRARCISTTSASCDCVCLPLSGCDPRREEGRRSASSRTVALGLGDGLCSGRGACPTCW